MRSGAPLRTGRRLNMGEHESSSSANSQEQQLPTALQLHVLSLLPANDRALSGRFACRDAADALGDPQHCTASLSQPLPPHAAPWAQEAGQQHMRQLPFRHKFQLLCAAARSGSEVNLEVAWALLEPSVFPELLQNKPDDRIPYPDTGVAAVRASHVHLLGWLLRRCPGTMQPDEVLAAAALHRPLAELQQAWETLRDNWYNGSSSGSRSRHVQLSPAVLDAAAQSHTPDAVAKAEWLVVMGAGSGCLPDSTAAAAACSGDLDRVQWLRDRGCPFGLHALCGALEEANLPFVEWLVGEGVCELPLRAGDSEDSSIWSWRALMDAAARSADGIAKLQWLQEQGAPSLMGADARLAQDLALSAVGAGRVEVVQYLLSAVGPAAVIRDASEQYKFGKAAVRSGSTQTVECLVQEAGLVLSHKAYTWAAKVGGVDMVRWLALEAGVSAAGCKLSWVVELWPCDTQAHSRDLLEAVRLVVGAGCCAIPLRRYDSLYAGQDAIAVAAERGDLALAQYLHRQHLGQMPVGQYLTAAVRGGCEALLEWLAQQPGWLDNEASPYTYAAAQADKGTLSVLRRLGAPWGDQDLLVQAVSWTRKVPVLRWLGEQGAPVGCRGQLMEAVDTVLSVDKMTYRNLSVEERRQLSGWAEEMCLGP